MNHSTSDDATIPHKNTISVLSWSLLRRKRSKSISIHERPSDNTLDERNFYSGGVIVPGLSTWLQDQLPPDGYRPSTTSAGDTTVPQHPLQVLRPPSAPSLPPLALCHRRYYATMREDIKTAARTRHGQNLKP